MSARLGAWVLRSPRAAACNVHRRQAGAHRNGERPAVRTAGLRRWRRSPPPRRRMAASRRGWRALGGSPGAITPGGGLARRNGSSRVTGKRTSAAGAVSACSQTEVPAARPTQRPSRLQTAALADEEGEHWPEIAALAAPARVLGARLMGRQKLSLRGLRRWVRELTLRILRARTVQRAERRGLGQQDCRALRHQQGQPAVPLQQ